MANKSPIHVNSDLSVVAAQSSVLWIMSPLQASAENGAEVE